MHFMTAVIGAAEIQLEGAKSVSKRETGLSLGHGEAINKAAIREYC